MITGTIVVATMIATMAPSIDATADRTDAVAHVPLASSRPADDAHDRLLGRSAVHLRRRTETARRG
ncbi:MAG: hypothetical protein ACQEWM_04700 [Actinomycetota bacterium]